MLRPGGRFVGELGGRLNVATIRRALVAALARRGHVVSPALGWYFPSVGEYAAVLETAGFFVIAAQQFARPTVLEGEDGLRRWLEMFATAPLSLVHDEAREAVLEEVEAACRERLYEGGIWRADYVRLRVVAVRAGEGGPFAQATGASVT